MTTRNNLIILIVFLISFLGIYLVLSRVNLPNNLITPEKLVKSNLQVKSIDTMKFSRDLAREKSKDPSFDKVIDTQVYAIAQTGATHVAIGTPYDEEFMPFMRKWVKTARKYGLKVWFRGNLSGWEGWFGYSKIDTSTAISLTEQFILRSDDLFEDGDIFSPCTECENGGPGDPRVTGDVSGHRQYLIDLYTISKNAFAKINKKVEANYLSMNGDVARLMMDKETTQSLGGIVVIDHYVKSPKKLADDVKRLAEVSGGKVVLGEFGAPVPDIHGDMSEEEQAEWLEEAFLEFKQIPQLYGINYWVAVGGSTELWNQQGEAKKAVEIIKNYYSN